MGDGILNAGFRRYDVIPHPFGILPFDFVFELLVHRNPPMSTSSCVKHALGALPFRSAVLPAQGRAILSQRGQCLGRRGMASMSSDSQHRVSRMSTVGMHGC